MRLCKNETGYQIDAEEIHVPSSAPYEVRLNHHFILDDESIEIHENDDKTGDELTEEAYSGAVSEGGKFQVDYDGDEESDDEAVLKNTVLFHADEADSTWYVWYKSRGDVYRAEDINERIKTVDGATGKLAQFKADGHLETSGKDTTDFADSTHAADHEQGAADAISSLPTADEKSALGAANDPDGDNPFATMDDIPDSLPPDAHAATHKGGGADAIDAATGSVNGLMPAADKTKLDEATNSNIASKMVIRDVNARAQFSDPNAAQDAATKNYVDTHNNLPTSDEKAALDGTDGDPSSTNKYVTNSDTRMTDDRDPNEHGNEAHNPDFSRQHIEINTQTGTTYTLVIGDDGKLIDCDNANPVTLTVPLNANVAFPAGTQALIRQKGAGQVTIEGDSNGTSVTIQSADGEDTTRVQHSVAGLIKVATDVWILFGDIE